MKASVAVSPVVQELFLAFVERVRALERELTQPDVLDRHGLFHSPEEVAIAERIQEMYPATYESPSEVLEVFGGAVLDVWNERRELDLHRIAEQFERPWSRFGIAVPFARSPRAGVFESRIGGRHELGWDLRWEEDAPKVWFTARIQAVSTYRAILTFERHLRAVVALAAAARLATIIDSRVPPRNAQIQFEPSERVQDLALEPRTAFLAAAALFHSGDVRFDADGELDEGAPLRQKIYEVLREHRPPELWSGALLLANALSTPDPDESIAFAVMSLEAMLVEPRDREETVGERLAPAIDALLGSGRSDRVADLCRARNQYVHNGHATTTSWLREHALTLAKDVARAKLVRLT